MALRYRSTPGRLAIVAAVLGSGMAFLDATAVNVVLPAIDADLDTGFAGLQWVLNAYLLTLSALVLPGGALGDRFGRRRVFVVGVTAFAAASVLCGMAPTIAVLVGARAIQGAAAALLVPASLAMIQGAIVADDRSEAIGAWSGFSGLTTLVGPLLGGWFADALSWRLVFLINPLLAVLTVVLAWRWVPESSDPRPRALDAPGALAAVVALGGLAVPLIQGPELGWTHPLVLAAGTAGAAAALAFVARETWSAQPMLPFSLFRRRRFTGITLATIPVYFALGGVMFLLTLQLQRVLGYSALGAGAAMAPVTLLLMALSPVAGRLAARHGPRLVLTAGPLTAAAGIAAMATISRGDSYAAGVLPPVLLFGTGLALTVAPLTATAMAALDDDDAGLASGVSNAVTRVGQLLAVSGLPLAAGLTGLDRVGGEAFSAGFARAAIIGAGIMAAGGLIALASLHGPPPGGART